MNKEERHRETTIKNTSGLEKLEDKKEKKEKKIKKQLKSTEKIKVGFEQGKMIGFVPSQQQLKRKSNAVLATIFIEKMEYFAGGALYNPTFIFSNGERSPPSKSYWEEDSDHSTVIQKDRDQIGTVIYGLDNIDFPYLVSLHFLDKSQNELVHIKGKRKVIKNIEVDI